MPEICDDILLLPVGNYSFGNLMVDKLRHQSYQWFYFVIASYRDINR